MIPPTISCMKVRADLLQDGTNVSSVTVSHRLRFGFDLTSFKLACQTQLLQGNPSAWHLYPTIDNWSKVVLRWFYSAFFPFIHKKKSLEGFLVRNVMKRIQFYETSEYDFQCHIQIFNSWTLLLTSRNNDELCNVSVTITAESEIPYAYSSMHCIYPWLYSIPTVKGRSGCFQ